MSINFTYIILYIIFIILFAIYIIFSIKSRLKRQDNIKKILNI